MTFGLKSHSIYCHTVRSCPISGQYSMPLCRLRDGKEEKTKPYHQSQQTP